MSEGSNRAVFLDRDGVLNVEGGSVVRPEDLQLLPGAVDAVARLTRAGWPVFVYTNQAAVGRGHLTLETLHAIHDRLQEEIEAAGGKLTAIYACPHHPDDGCACRKPRPGMLLQAAAEHGLDLTGCYAVGDTPRDIHAAHQVGCHTILVLSGHTTVYDADTFPSPQPEQVFPDLAAATDWLSRLPM
jgi:histidinol-phosphate phosphatase family protein